MNKEDLGKITKNVFGFDFTEVDDFLKKVNSHFKGNEAEVVQSIFSLIHEDFEDGISGSFEEYLYIFVAEYCRCSLDLDSVEQQGPVGQEDFYISDEDLNRLKLLESTTDPNSLSGQVIHFVKSHWEK